MINSVSPSFKALYTRITPASHEIFSVLELSGVGTSKFVPLDKLSDDAEKDVFISAEFDKKDGQPILRAEVGNRIFPDGKNIVTSKLKGEIPKELDNFVSKIKDILSEPKKKEQFVQTAYMSLDGTPDTVYGYNENLLK